MTIPPQNEVNEDWYARSKAEWDSRGGHPAFNNIGRTTDTSLAKIDEHIAARRERHELSTGSAEGFSLPLDWSDLASKTPPERDWIEEHWLGKGHVTLMAGAGGIGKTAVAQAWGSCLAIRRSYLDWVPAQRNVLMWACEDDENEMWRRQVAIAKWLGVPLTDFAGHFFAHSFCGAQVELAGFSAFDHNRLSATSMMTTLRDQIGDYKADVVVLDNIARLYAGNENDRHQVTSFIAMLTGAAPDAAILLLGHPGKAVGSEYSGSTAWEGAVRSRLYLGATLPDAPESESDAPADDTVRYLCRRKANYSARDWRRIKFIDGVMVAEAAPENGGKPIAANPEYAVDVVERAVRKLATMDLFGTCSKGSPNYLPKLAKYYKLIDNITDRQFAAAMRDMQVAGRLIVNVVGKYPNRTPRHGLAIVESP